jgi:glutamate/tyrosine decarboxylase-like PLP-dependent enzyme
VSGSDARLDHESLELLAEALRTLDDGFEDLPALRHELDGEALGRVLRETAARLHDNYPYFHPLYVGQMLKPPHPIARIAYALAMWINPNNHALDGGRASSAMEKEAVAEIAGLFGWEDHLGHLCGGGTMANLEALWVAREQRPGRAVLASAGAHYTHERLTGVLGMPFRAVAVDERGRMDLDALAHHLERGDVGTVVATLGATATGAVDRLDRILELTSDVRVHVDAAYGGYFTLAESLGPQARAAFDALEGADSIVIDPHKHGLQPYGCGCVVFRDPDVGRVYRHDSTYTYFTSEELHLGEISLECSRPGASAVALWATQRLLPYVRGGRFARDLDRCIAGARALHARLEGDDRFVPVLLPELDIVVFAVRPSAGRAASELARAVFERAADDDLHLALAGLDRSLVEAATGPLDEDGDTILCLRACVMKPEHEAWLGAILERLDRAAAAVGLFAG